MDPNQPQPTNPQQPISMDYLNQIAPQTPKRKLPLTKMQLIIFGVLALAVVVVMILVIVVNAGGGKKPTQQLAARLQSTQTIVNGAKAKLKSSTLRALNSSLDSYLTTTNRDISALLLKDGVDVTKLDKDIVAKEAGTDITTRLEDARLNAIYDRTYAREISYRLETLISLMQQIYKSTSNKNLKAFLDTAYKNLQPTQKAFADFNEGNGN